MKMPVILRFLGVLLISGFILGSCNVSIDLSGDNDFVFDADSCQILSIIEGYVPSTTRDQFGIDSLFIIEDCLIMDVTYSGGCEDHEFELIWNGVVTGNSINNFISDKIVLSLAHDDKGDACEAFLQEYLLFDLKPLQQDGLTKLTLELRNTQDILVYKY